MIESGTVVDEDEDKTEILEDIYGRKRDTAENIINDFDSEAVDPSGAVEPSKYIPPARRNKTSLGSRV